MKAALHAIAGVLGFIMISAIVLTTAITAAMGDPATMTSVGKGVFYSMFAMPVLLAAAGGTGVSMLGKRNEPLASKKQKRGPMAFMTSLLVLLPSSFFIQWRASDGLFDGIYYGVQGLEWVAGAFCFVMIGLNIRDGLALTGRIASGSKTGGPEIDRRDGGPLVIKSLPILVDADGNNVTTKPVMALCRCGASKNKPFCDGSHNNIGFDSSTPDNAARDKVLVYEGEEITIHYNRMLCSHAAECGKRSKAAFDSSRKPWIKPDEATAKELMEIVKACPSGALRFSRSGGAPEHSLPEDVKVTVERNGPLRVLGLPLVSPQLADGASPTKYVLCRCGQSKNKPFCDGSHFDVNWKDA